MLNLKIKQIGNSVGIIIPKEIATSMNLKPESEVVVDIQKKGNVLKELFGSLPNLKKADLRKVRMDLESKYEK